MFCILHLNSITKMASIHCFIEIPVVRFLECWKLIDEAKRPGVRRRDDKWGVLWPIARVETRNEALISQKHRNIICYKKN